MVNAISMVALAWRDLDGTGSEIMDRDTGQALAAALTAASPSVRVGNIRFIVSGVFARDRSYALSRSRPRGCDALASPQMVPASRRAPSNWRARPWSHRAVAFCHGILVERPQFHRARPPASAIPRRKSVQPPSCAATFNLRALRRRLALLLVPAFSGCGGRTLDNTGGIQKRVTRSDGCAPWDQYLTLSMSSFSRPLVLRQQWLK